MNLNSPRAPKVSVVTVVYNGEKHIEQAIISVISQTYPNFEYIIVDGGSTDNTLGIIKRYEGRIDKWVSEPDKGISDAMNKGIGMSSGDYILFIHADDYLDEPDSLRDCIEEYPLTKDVHVYDVNFIAKNGVSRLHSSKLSFWTNFKGQFCHQGMLCSKETFEKVGLFDTGLKIKMDYDLLLRCYRAGLSFSVHPKVISNMRDTGVSSARDSRTVLRKLREEKAIHMRHCPSQGFAFLYMIWWACYPVYIKTRHKFFRDL